jgi:HK97 family phage major capsid protein
MDINAVVERLKGEINGGVAELVRSLNDKHATLEQNLNDGLDELRKRLARGEKIDSDTGITVTRQGRVIPAVPAETAKFLVRAFRKDPEALKVMRELGSAAGANGGYTIPREYVAELLKLVYIYGQARQLFRGVTMAHNEQAWPRLDGDMTVAWIGENTAGTESEPTFGEVVLNAKKLMALTHVPSELLDDSELAIGQVIADSIARAYGKEEDRVAFSGTGIAGDGGVTGLLNTAGANVVRLGAAASGKINATDITPDHLLDALNSMPAEGLYGAEFLLHRSVLNVIRRAKAEGSGEYYTAPLQGEPGTLWGIPYRLVEMFPTVALATADKTVAVLTNATATCMFGDRKTMDVRTSEQFAFNKDQTFIRAIERVAIAPGVLPTGIVQIKTATS